MDHVTQYVILVMDQMLLTVILVLKMQNGALIMSVHALITGKVLTVLPGLEIVIFAVTAVLALTHATVRTV